MVARVEVPEHQALEHDADEESRRQREQQTDDKAAAPSREHRREIGADHVERAVRQIDEVHHPEHERQPGRDEKQQDTELHAVEGLQEEEVQHLNTRHARA